MAVFMEQWQSSSISQRSAITGLVLIDATGKRHDISMDFAVSYVVCLPDSTPEANLTPFPLCDNDQMFADAMKLLFKKNTLEARVQREYMQEGRYDLAIDGGNDVIAISGQQDWF